MSLPDGHGDEIITHVAENRVESKVIVVSGDLRDESRQEALSLGADDYIKKSEMSKINIKKSIN